jgi:phage terminase large subunit
VSQVLELGRPQPKQAEVARARNKYIAYGGSRGPGKSWFVRFKAAGLALRYDGIKILILRRTYKELQNNHIDILRGQLYGFAKYNDSDKRFIFPNGSTISFGYCDADSHVLQYQGAEYDVIFIDEATQLKEEWLRVFPACLRGVNEFPKRIYYTCNPGGVSHGFIKRLFIDREFRDGENPDDYLFVKALVTDNRVLLDSQPDYLAQLEALPYKLRKAWLEGDWTILEGAFFEEFTDDPEHYEDRRYTHVIAPFDLTEGEARRWTIYRSFDWGSNRPSSTGWYAVDYDGVIYAILELYTWTGEPNQGNHWTDVQIFNEIKRIEDTHPWLKGKQIRGVADPSIWGKGNGTGISTAETAAQCGVHFTPADNDRIPGWMQVHYRMSFDEEGRPGLYIFKNCKQLIRTIPLQMYDRVRVEDLDSDMEDHAVDQLRYMCQARPIKPARVVEREPVLYDPLDQYANIKPFRRV